jgi:hypothetical protein
VGEPPLIAAAYDAIADDFARRNAAMPEPLVALGEELLARLPAQPELLDAGCGAGRDLRAAGARPAARGLRLRRRPGDRERRAERPVAGDDRYADGPSVSGSDWIPLTVVYFE